MLPNTKYVMDELQKICDAENQILTISEQINSLNAGHIKIGTIQSIAYHWLPNILKDFSEQYPNIRFEVYVSGFRELNEMLKKGELDLIFTSKYASAEYEFSNLGTDELLLVTPRNHEFSEQITVSLEALDGQNYISTADRLDYEAGQLFHLYKIHPNIRYELNEDFAALKMVETGFGITILPKLLLRNVPFDVCVRSFTEHFTRILGVAYRSTDSLSPAASVFVNYTKEWYEKREL